MTVSDYESKFDEMERDSLQKAISEVERTLASSGTQKPMPLANFVENAKGRIAALDRKIKESQAEREGRAREQVAIIHLAQKEAALSAAEKETYSGFLGKEFFTKNDFASLETFYAQTWDRLSESGKDEMSHRIWEGVRRDEYKFSELPKSVREKETERAYMRLRDSTIDDIDSARIPEKDKQDFIRAYESDDRQKAGKVLERESFKENMFRTSDNTSNRRAAMNLDRETTERSVADGAVRPCGANVAEKSRAPSSGPADIDLSGFNLDGVKLTEVKNQGSSADLPRGEQSQSAQTSTRGG